MTSRPLSLNIFFSPLDKSRLKTIRVLFPLHRESLTAYFSPILGQYAIKNSEFINAFISHFHEFTANVFKDILNNENPEEQGFYSEELLIPVIVYVYKGGKFSISLGLPSLGFLFSTYLKKRRRIYKRWNNKLVGLRSYKKLMQLAFFKQKKIDTLNILDISTYKLTRNALFQKF